MLSRSDPLDELAIPDGTTVEEHDLVASGDVLVGGQSTVEFGVRGRNVIAGERVRFGGHIEAEEDVRLDMWSDVAADVLVGGDAYLGERVHVGGQLKVAGDIDIGDDVDIEEGFEANGWIVIRNPMPTIVFLFVYLSQLLRLGEKEAAEDLLGDLVDGDGKHNPVVIPRGGTVSDDAWRVSTPATVGDDCRIHGNIRAETVAVGRDTLVFGSLRGKGDVTVGRGTEIKGDVTTRDGDVFVGPGVKIWGDIAAGRVRLHENATVDGTIRARSELELHTDAVLDRPDDDAEAMAELGAEMTSDDLPSEDAGSADTPETDEADEESTADEASDEESTGDGDADEEVDSESPSEERAEPAE